MNRGSLKLWNNLSPFIILLLALYLRLDFILRGGRFIASPLKFAYQYLDPLLLKEDLLRSLHYLHSQPPLFNLFLGIILKISPIPDLTFNLLFVTAGIITPLLLYGVLISLEMKPFPSLLITSLFMFNPTLILYENLLYYTFVEAFLVLLAIFHLLHWEKERKSSYLFLFWISLLGLGMIRSLFHPLFFLITAALLWWQISRIYKLKILSRKFACSSLIALIPIFSLCLKNAFLFGFFGTSSWYGINLWTKVNGFTPEELEDFHARGIISSLALKADLKPFQSIQAYFDDSVIKGMPCHHPGDCNLQKSTNYPNYNHMGYIYLSKQLWKDALHLITYDPSLFLFFTAGSYCLTLWHSSDSVHVLFENNMEVVKQRERFYRFLNFGFIGVQDRYSVKLKERTLLITLFYLVFYLSTLYHQFWRDPKYTPPILLTLTFCLLIHIYTLLISSLIEFGENNRFRFPVDSAFLVLIFGNIMIWKGWFSIRFQIRKSKKK